jgi:hypothetical protein
MTAHSNITQAIPLNTRPQVRSQTREGPTVCSKTPSAIFPCSPAARRESCANFVSPCTRPCLPVGSAADLAYVEPETVFDITRPMEATFHQRLDPLLAGRPAQGGKECLPFGSDVRIRW